MKHTSNHSLMGTEMVLTDHCGFVTGRYFFIMLLDDILHREVVKSVPMWIGVRWISLIKIHVCLIVINNTFYVSFISFVRFSTFSVSGAKCWTTFPLSYQQRAIKLSRGHLYQILHACHHQASHQVLHSSLLLFLFHLDSICFLDEKHKEEHIEWGEGR